MIWLTFALITVAAVGYVARTLLSRGITTDRSYQDVDVYADQLTEIERDRARGLLSETDYASAKVEIGRRLLMAEGKAVPSGGSSRLSKQVALVLLCFILPAAAFLLYGRLGQPYLSDLPLTSRIIADAGRQESPSGGQPDIEAVIERAERLLAQNGQDSRGWRLIAPVYMQLGRLDDAINAWKAVLEIEGPSYEVLSSLGEAHVVQTGGEVTDEAANYFQRASKENAEGLQARFYLALRASQQEEHQQAALAWASLLSLDAAKQNADQPWVAAALQQLSLANDALGEDAVPIPEIAPEGGQEIAQETAPVPADQGVTTADINAMVAGLADRLANEGGSLAEWQRLLRSYIVLGNRAAATQTLMAGLADLRQSGDEEAVEAFKQQAASFGLTPTDP